MSAAPLDFGGHPALLREVAAPRYRMVLAHGAGAGMRHVFMEALAEALAACDIETVRWDLPFMAAGKKRPDPAPVCEAATRAVCAAVAMRWPDQPLVVAGKSMGGRMASRAQAEASLPAVGALVFYGFPLHPAKAPSIERAAHLAKVEKPMLFLSGTRDALAELPLLRVEIAKLGARATLDELDGADHGFALPAARARTSPPTPTTLAERTRAWLDRQPGLRLA